MKSKKDVKNIIKILKETYPEAECSLDFSNPFQMAIAVLLSAQCTDARVNIVTKELFKIAPNAKEMNKLTVEEIEKYISSCGLYKTKAKNIKKLAEKVVKEYDGNIPDNMEELMELPGIGRKSAEKDLLKKLDKEDYFDANHLCVWHGRYTCKARRPECERCTITKYCDYFKIKNI